MSNWMREQILGDKNFNHGVELKQVASIEYTILSSDSHNDLMEKVKDLIKKGWVPQGGVSSNWNTMSGSECAQAMVKPIVEKWVKQY